jgi:hypothetical protein
MTERELLDRLGLPYMLTGSTASGFWGVPRTTHDLDFVLVLEPAVSRRIAEAFGDDFATDEVAVSKAVAPPHMFNAIDLRS